MQSRHRVLVAAVLVGLVDGLVRWPSASLAGAGDSRPASRIGLSPSACAQIEPKSSLVPAEPAELTSTQMNGLPVLALCCAIASVCALDRVVISIAIIPMGAEMGLTDEVKGLVAAAFSLGYCAGLLPAGLLSTLSSPKLVLGGGLLLWSAAQSVTPAAAAVGVPALLTARAVMGLGEAAATPCLQVIAANFVPAARRAQFWGVLSASLSMGTISAYLVSPPLIESYGWQSVFAIYGGAGAVLAAAWMAVGRSAPETDAECVPDSCDVGTAEDLQRRGPTPWGRGDEVPWRQLFTSRPVWAMTAAHSASNFFLYFALSWLPSYFNYQFGLDAAAASSASLAPFAAGAVGSVCAGALADGYIERTGVSLSTARKAAQTVGALGPASAMAALALLGEGVGGLSLDRQAAENLFVLGIFSQAFCAAGYGVGAQDISKRYASLVYGASSAVSVVAGALGQYFTGWLLQANGRDFSPMFALTAGIEVLGLLAFVSWWDSERVFE